MQPIINITMKDNNLYSDSGIMRNIKDRFHIKNNGKRYIQDLNVYIKDMIVPPNCNTNSYNKNIFYAAKHSHYKDYIMSPCGIRKLDYYIYNPFQKRLFGYSVIKSVQLILTLKHKNIKNSCIVFYDASREIMKNIIYETARLCNCIILLSKNKKMCMKLREYITSEYGTAPIICTDFKYAEGCADFMIISEGTEFSVNKPVWYIDNMFSPEKRNELSINNVAYFTPWVENDTQSFELLGAILSQMEERDIEKALKYNGVYINEIKFNNQIISI